jgi:ABC-2 type transport system ATP-binding protein
MQQKFFNIISEENKKGATVFFSSHILSEVQELCDRVAIINEGTIIKIDEIKTLREENYKKITLKGSQLLSSTFMMDGVTEVKEEEHGIKFYYKGDINKMTHAISSQNLVDVLIEEPTLEEIFMHYYK